MIGTHIGPRTLRAKVGVYLGLGLAAAMLLFAILVVRNQRQALLEAAVHQLNQISEVVIKSTRYAMLRNEPDYVLRIIQDVGHQPNIVKVRILSKEGTIIHSSDASEIGRTVNRVVPLERVPGGATSRIYSGPHGQRLLGSMEVIHNQASCYSASCHEHSRSQSVLGVLDIVYSLDKIDNKMETNSFTIAAFSLGFIVIASLLVSGFIGRLVYAPLRDLESGAKRLSSGNLEQLIPVRSKDEFGQLAESFNAMTVALKDSRADLQEWAHTLERKVAERTKELRIAEAETARSEKLASVGLLAAGIAHELNNPLTGILTFSHLLRKKMPEGSQDAEDMDLVIRETKRCAAIIRRLLDFAREKPPQKKFADINKIIANASQIIDSPATFRDIKIHMDLDPDLPPLWGDADLMEQVIVNMLVNAQHAIEHEGDITIRTRRIAKPQGSEQGIEPEPMLELTIADNGSGIPQENLQRIFDPFFTTKEVGKGTGLGLSVSHGIVTAHGGTIEVESKVGEGSTFRVYLPLKPPTEALEGEKLESKP